MARAPQDTPDALPRQAVEAELRRSLAEQMISAARLMLHRSSGVESPVAGIAQLAVPQLADWCVIDLLTSDGGEIDRVAVGHLPGLHEIAESLQHRYSLRSEDLAGVARAISEGAAFLTHDLGKLSFERLASAAPESTRPAAPFTGIVAPLLIRGKVIGALTLVSAEREYVQTDVWIAEQLAQLAASVIDTAQLQNADFRIRALLAELQEITVALSAAPTREKVAQLACQMGKVALDAKYSAIWFQGASGTFELAAHGDAPAELVASFRTIPHDASLLVQSEVLRLTKAVWVRTTPAALGIPSLVGAQVFWFGTVAVGPIHSPDGLLLFCCDGRGAHDSVEQAFLLGLGQQVSQARERIRLSEVGERFHELERRAQQRVEILARAGETLARSLDLDETLRAVAKFVAPALADWCTIDLVEDGAIRRVAVEHQDRQKLEQSLAVAARYQTRLGDGSAIARVIADKATHFHPHLSAALLATAARDDLELAALQRAGIVSVIVVPLIVRGACIGALSLTTSDSGRVYDSADATFAEELARRAALAIANAQLHRQTADAHGRMNRIFAQVPLALATYEGPEHRFAFANPLYLEARGKTLDVIGQRYVDVFPDGRETYLPLLDSVYTSGSARDVPELQVSLRRGGCTETAFFDCSLVPIRDAAGSVNGLISASFDMTERVLMRRMLEQERSAAAQMKERLALALEAGEVGAWDFDPIRGELFWDARCRVIHGLATDAPLERNALFDLIHPEDRAGARSEVAQALAGNHDRELALNYRITRASDGAVRWMKSRGRVYFDGGRATRMVGIITDETASHVEATERAALLEREQSARSEAERANRTKDEFLATVSHELRTPLHTISGWSEILSQHPEDTATVVRGIAVLQRSARAQARLIDDILDVSRITTGKIGLTISEFDLVQALREVCDAARPAADEQGIQLDFESSAELVRIHGDPQRIQQVASNLLQNAVKFTPRGGRIALTVQARAAQVKVSIKDSGRGIAPEFLPLVFERFRQADSSTTRAVGGLGLGLAIVRHLVEAHSGEVIASSAGLGLGATFEVTLPLPGSAGALASVQKKASETEARTPLHGLRVLVVDDDDDGRELIVRLLRRQGAVTIGASSAAQAWTLLETGRFDVVVSDVAMPVEDGHSLIRRMRARGDDIAKIGAIALTAYTQDIDQTNALDAGFDAHVAKPVDSKQLTQVVAELASKRARAIEAN